MTVQETHSRQSLPPGWRWVKLGDIALRGPDNGIFKHRNDFGSGVPIVNVSDLYRSLHVDLSITERVCVTKDELKQYEVVPGDLFFCRSSLKREGIGWCCLVSEVNEPAVFECHVMRVRLVPADAIPEYVALYWQHPTVRENIIGNSRTATMTTMNQQDLGRVAIPLAPLPEQRRIAGLLKAQMAAVEKARAAAHARLDAVKAMPAAYMCQVFPQPGQPLPPGWRSPMLGDLCEGPGQYGTSKKSNGDRNGTPVLGMYHIYDGRIRWEKLSHIELRSDERLRYLLSCGDLLFNRTNSAELVGKTAVYDQDAEAVFASYLIRFRLAKDTADPHFVCAYINSRNGRSFIERNMARAIGQVNISASTMHKMPVPIPDIAEQRLISGVLREQIAAVEKARVAGEEELLTINALPAALLRQAFSGEV